MLPRRFTVALLLAVTVAGCLPGARHEYYVRPEADFSFIKRVAILPFENLTQNKDDGERLRKMFACELLASGLVDVASLGETTAACTKAGLESGAAVKPSDAKSLCGGLAVQALLYGTVSALGESRSSGPASSSGAEVAVTFVMVDEAGATMWSSNIVTSGGGFWTYYMGGRGESVHETSLRAIRRAIRTLHH
ncbi:MAG: hypothetical protein V2A77_00385 [Pseudomonadota bacterium]